MFSRGEFGYDLNFLKDHIQPVVLSGKNGKEQIIIAPEYQGRVMTSTSSGLRGRSYGWINHDLIASHKIQQRINPFGGEDRFWIGPEGGQFGLFFTPGNTFTFENSQVPPAIDREPFSLLQCNETSATLIKEAALMNYSGTLFQVELKRKVNLLSRDEIEKIIDPGLENIQVVGFESENEIVNLGKDWKMDSGLLSVWTIGMFNASDHSVVIVPINDAGAGINADYFGPLSEKRLLIKDRAVYFLGDGKYRSKIGIHPSAAKPVSGSFDYEHNLLTIVQFSFDGTNDYVNSMWEIQEEPYHGDVINAYNDGPPPGTASQLGKFYELESSSPAKELRNGESIVHHHRTFHFEGEKKLLAEIGRRLLNADLNVYPFSNNND